MNPTAVGEQPAAPSAADPDPPNSPFGSFEEFYRANADRVHRALAVTLGDAHLAREATDEGMARACARWKRVAELNNPGGWVYRVGLNWATSWWRKVRREQPMPDGGAADLRVTSPTDPAASAAVVALRRLSTVYRAVVVCRVLLDLSTAETAAVLEISEGTVKSRLARALAALRTALTEEGEA